jgi:hypothetical protein
MMESLLKENDLKLPSVPARSAVDEASITPKRSMLKRTTSTIATWRRCACVKRPLVASAHVAGAAENARRPVTCERGWFKRCGTQLTALMTGRTLL